MTKFYRFVNNNFESHYIVVSLFKLKFSWFQLQDRDQILHIGPIPMHQQPGPILQQLELLLTDPFLHKHLLTDHKLYLEETQPTGLQLNLEGTQHSRQDILKVNWSIAI